MKKRKKRIRVDSAFDPPGGSLTSLIERNQDEDSAALKRLHQKRLGVYKAQVAQVGEALLRCALRAFAAYDAALKVNEKLQENFGMDEESGIDLDVVLSVLRQTMRAEVARIIVTKTTLRPRDRDAIIERVIARMLPTVDSPPQAARPEIQRKTLESLVRSEARRITQGVKTLPEKPQNPPRDGDKKKRRFLNGVPVL